MLPWFKSFADSRHDGKLWTLNGDQFRCFYNLLCWASVQPTRGVIVSDNEAVLAHETTRGDVALLNETLALLEALHCVSCVSETVSSVSTGVSFQVTRRTIAFLNFDKRQGVKRSSIDRDGEFQPAASTIRVRKHRENKRLRETGTSECPKHDEAVSTGVSSSVSGVSSCVSSPQEVEAEREVDTEFAPQPPERVRASLSVPRPPTPLRRLPGEEGTEVAPPGPGSRIPPKAESDPLEVERAMTKADELFPGLELGPRVRTTAREYPVAWISEALDVARDSRDADARSGKRVEPMRWTLIRRILERFHREGMPDSEKTARELAAKEKAAEAKEEPRPVVYFKADYEIDYSKMPRLQRRSRAV